MASATSTAYSAAAGGKVYGGRTDPGVSTPSFPAVWGQAGSGSSGNIMSLRPAAGYLKSIHANTLSSVNPCPSNSCWYSESSGQNGSWGNWCGAVFSPDYSAAGAMVYWGGGHGGYDGVEFYLFDLSTQLWSRLGNTPPTDFITQTSVDWCDIDYLGHKIPPASHTYSHPVYLPPSLGGGVKGSWLLPFNVFGAVGSSYGGPGYKPHAFDLATQVWTRFTTNTTTTAYPAYGGCFVDTVNGNFWGMAGSEGQTAAKIDLKASPKSFVDYNYVYAPPQYFVPIFVPEKAYMVACSIYDNGVKRIDLTGYDLSSGKPVAFGITFAAPQIADLGIIGIGMDWCPDTGKFYLYEGYGTSKVYVATPPASGDWVSGTWTWSTETMLDETPVNIQESGVLPGAQGAQPFTKWKYNSVIKCFMWSQGTAVRNSPDGVSRNGAFQLYRPLGT